MIAARGRRGDPPMRGAAARRGCSATMRTQLLAGLAALASAGAVAAPASATPSSSSRTRTSVAGTSTVVAAPVARDGTADVPYSSPSQDDRGAIAAAHGYGIDRVDRRAPASRASSRGTSRTRRALDPGAPAWVSLRPTESKVAVSVGLQLRRCTIDAARAADDRRGRRRRPPECASHRGLYGGGALGHERPRPLPRRLSCTRTRSGTWGRRPSRRARSTTRTSTRQGNSTSTADGEVSRNGAATSPCAASDVDDQLVCVPRSSGSIQSGREPPARSRPA